MKFEKMDEYLNRMEAHRHVLVIVNKKQCWAEELCGLSRKSIERWLNVNKIDPTAEVAWLLIEISSKLFFLSNKSQEQITDEYRCLSREIGNLTTRLQQTLGKRSSAQV